MKVTIRLSATREPDRPWKQNQELANKIRADWPAASRSDAHDGIAGDAANRLSSGGSEKVVELLNAGIAPESIWAALFDGAGELDDARSEHPFAARRDDDQRDALRLRPNGQRQHEATAAVAKRGIHPAVPRQSEDQGLAIDQLEPLSPKKSGSEAVAEILADISHDRQTAARKVLAYAKDNPMPKELIDAARLMIFFKGRDAHDYKFSSAVMEDYAAMQSPWRERYLAASVFNLKGNDDPENSLVKRIRAALEG